MALTYTKDIVDFNRKVKEAADVTELEITVGQLSASMLEVQGDISTLAGAVTVLDGEVEELQEQISNVSYEYVEVTITNPGGTLYQNNYVDLTSSTTVESGKELVGFISLNAGSKYFCISQISLNADRKIVASICNMISSGQTYDSNIKFIAVIKSTT